MELITIKKRSALATYRANSGIANTNAIVGAINSISGDLGDLINEHNNKVKPAFAGLALGTSDSIDGLDSTKDAIANGIDGRSIFIDRTATEDSSEWEYSTDISRILTLKESLAEIYNSLANRISSISLEANSISSYTKQYIGEKAFDATQTSSPTSIDARLTALEDGSTLPDFTDTEILFADGTNVPVTDPAFTFDSTTATLAVDGLITHTAGIQSVGGATRGTGAADLQVSRTSPAQVASGDYSLVAGIGNTASGSAATALGNGNTASGANSFATGGTNTASSKNSIAFGKETRADILNVLAIGPGKFSSLGDCQTYLVPLAKVTTDGASQVMSTDSGVSSTIGTLDNSAYILNIQIVGKNASNLDCCYYTVVACVERGSGAGTIVTKYVATTTLFETQPGCNATVTVDTGGGTIDIKVQGIVASTYNWSGLATITVVKT